MGRGAGKTGGSGGRAGGFSSGGSRGFSSHRSSNNSSSSLGRGGGSSASKSSSSSSKTSSSSYRSSNNRGSSLGRGGVSSTKTSSSFSSKTSASNHRSSNTTRNGFSRDRSSSSWTSGFFGSGQDGYTFTTKPMPASPPPRTIILQNVVTKTSSNMNVDGNVGDAQYKNHKKNGLTIPFIFTLCLAIFLFIVSVGIKSSTANTLSREKLAGGICISSNEVMSDELGWITDKKSVTDGIAYFYKKTGVQPYLLICDNMNGKGADITDEEAEEYLAQMYDLLFKDEGHMIFAFMEYDTSLYITYIYTGTAADGVIDSDAREIFLNTADRYYMDTSLSDEEYFKAVFTKSADDIMYSNETNLAVSRGFKFCGNILLAIAFGLMCAIIWCKVKDKQLQEAEKLKEILDTPLYNNTTTDDNELKEKYK